MYAHVCMLAGVTLSGGGQAIVPLSAVTDPLFLRK